VSGDKPERSGGRAASKEEGEQQVKKKVFSIY
jgi:hypothetical protein